MKLRQLDDSDDCVFVYDDPSGNEIFSVGIYVDNAKRPRADACRRGLAKVWSKSTPASNVQPTRRCALG